MLQNFQLERLTLRTERKKREKESHRENRKSFIKEDFARKQLQARKLDEKLAKRKTREERRENGEQEHTNGDDAEQTTGHVLDRFQKKKKKKLKRCPET